MINEVEELRWQERAQRKLGPHWQEILEKRDWEERFSDEEGEEEEWQL